MKRAARWDSSLLQTKLFVPVARADTIARPRLLEQLDHALALGHKLVLVSAPPGFGKTTLLTTWLTQNAAAMLCAWLSLDAGDNDHARFFLHLLGALDRATHAPDDWEEIAALVQAPTAPPPSSLPSPFSTRARN